MATLVRAYAELAGNLTEAGYSNAEAGALQSEVEFYGDTRAAIKKHSGEELDIKPFEGDMRHLLNTYIQADPANDLGNLMSSLSLVELIVETGIHDAIARSLNAKGKLSRDAVAEAIINNIRKTIVRNQLTDPRFYAEMSKLLDDLIRQSRSNTTTYEAFLLRAEDLATRLVRKKGRPPSRTAERIPRSDRALQQSWRHSRHNVPMPHRRGRKGQTGARTRLGHA